MDISLKERLHRDNKADSTIYFVEGSKTGCLRLQVYEGKSAGLGLEESTK